jgi:hypothetical protein
VGLLGGFLVQAVLVGLGGIIPTTLQLSMYRIFDDEYTYIQIPNWGWTLAAVWDRDLPFAIDQDVLAACLLIAAIPILIINLGVAAKEVAQTRQAAPLRVLKDDASHDGASLHTG